ncbi:MAG: MBL fold metallo-hydrolase, partial [Planctomycetales bacterium]
MKVRLLPTGHNSLRRYCFVTSFVINDVVALDAGALGHSLSLEEQIRIRHVFLTHSHIDHIASLPLFLENVYQTHDECVTVHASQAVLSALQQHLFNGVIWPDFIQMSQGSEPFLRLQTLEPGRSLQVEGLTVTPVAVTHPVPTMGFLIDDRAAAGG